LKNVATQTRENRHAEKFCPIYRLEEEIFLGDYKAKYIWIALKTVSAGLVEWVFVNY
jgi:hypothetical protein